MRSVGVRELKENLSRYLRDVKSGERIVVTERRKRVALLVPVANGEEDDRILDLIRSGVADWSGGKPRGVRPGVRAAGKRVSRTVLDERR